MTKTTKTKKRKPAPKTATSTSTDFKHRRMARPATSKRAIEAARLRTQELLAVLAIRGKPIDRHKLSPAQLRCLDIGPYPPAAAAYLKTHEKFVESQVRKVSARHVPDEDVAQAVRIAMLKSLDRFDARLAESGQVTSFLSYARWWVRCEVGKLLEDECLVKVPSAAKKTATEMRAKVDAMAVRIGSAPEYLTDEDVAIELEISLDKVRTYRHLHLSHEHFDATVLGVHRDKLGEGEDAASLVVVERITKLQSEVAEDAIWKLRGGQMEVALTKLPALHRRVLGDHFGVEVDVSSAALHLSATATRAVLGAAIGRLRQMLDIEAA